MKNRFIVLTALIVIFSTGCADNRSNDKFKEKIAVDIKPYFDIKVLDQLPVKQNTTINLYIKNTINECFVFPQDFGVRIMSFVNNEWVDIPDKAIPMTQGDIKLDVATSLFPDGALVIHPDISSVPNIKLPASIRVVLIGNICKNGSPTDKKIGNYVDIDIYP